MGDDGCGEEVLADTHTNLWSFRTELLWSMDFKIGSSSVSRRGRVGEVR